MRTEGVATEAREKVGETVGHLKEQVVAGAEHVRESADHLREQVAQGAGRVREQAAQVPEYARQQWHDAQLGFWQTMDQKPLAVGMAALAAGVAAGLTVPSTRKENELMGETRDRLLDQAKDLGREAADKGKQVARVAADVVKTEVEKQGLKPAAIADKVRTITREAEQALKSEAGKVVPEPLRATGVPRRRPGRVEPRGRRRTRHVRGLRRGVAVAVGCVGSGFHRPRPPRGKDRHVGRTRVGAGPRWSRPGALAQCIVAAASRTTTFGGSPSTCARQLSRAAPVKGFTSRMVPGSRMPRAPSASLEYPDMKTTLIAGRRRSDLPRDLRAAHARHDHVAQQEIDDPGVTVRDRHRGGSAIRLQDRVAPLAQHAGHELAEGDLVLHEEDRLRAVPRRLRRTARRSVHRLVDPREVEAEGRSPPGGGLDGDVALALLHFTFCASSSLHSSTTCPLFTVNRSAYMWMLWTPRRPNSLISSTSFLAERIRIVGP